MKNWREIFFSGMMGLFLLTWPIERRHIFNLNTAEIAGHFNEWLAVSLYFSDLVFIGLLVSWYIWGGSDWKKTFRSAYFYLLAGLVAIGFFSLIANEFTSLTTTGWLRIGEGALLLLMILDWVKKEGWVKFSFIAAAGLAIQGFLGMIQIIRQGSIGLNVLGEIDFSPEMENIAKFSVDGEKFIRAVGTFPHANIFGGAMALGLILSLGLCLFFGRRLNVSRETNSKNEIYFLFCLVFSAMTFAGLIVSFSRSAWLAGGVGAAGLLGYQFGYKVKSWKRLAGKMRVLLGPIIIWIAFILTTLISLWPMIRSRLAGVEPGEYDWVSGRMSLSEAAMTMIQDNFWFGVGPGEFVDNLLSYFAPEFWWQFQPVHNLFLLIGAEIGVLGLGIMAILLSLIFGRGLRRAWEGRGQWMELFLPLILAAQLVILAFFDHYFWSIEQGRWLWWICLGLVAAMVVRKRIFDRGKKSD